MAVMYLKSDILYTLTDAWVIRNQWKEYVYYSSLMLTIILWFQYQPAMSNHTMIISFDYVPVWILMNDNNLAGVNPGAVMVILGTGYPL